MPAPTAIVDSDDDDANADVGPNRANTVIKRTAPAVQVIEDSDSENDGAQTAARYSAAEKGKGRAANTRASARLAPVAAASGSDVDMQEMEELDGEEDNDFEEDDNEVQGQSAGRRAKAKEGAKKTTFSWEEEYSRSWDALTEDVHGSLEGAVAAFLTSSKRRRILRDTASIQRGIIRHLFLILDLSESMTDRDMRPTRLDLTLRYAAEFVSEFFDQNPISQLAIVGTRDGMAERLSQLGGNPVEHMKALQNKRKLMPSGEPSLQNALNMARSGLAHLPTHGSREVVVVFGSLTTCDPANIHDTIDALIKDRIRVNIIGLAAELSVCREIAKRTRGTFTVCLNEDHFKDLLFEAILPPASLKPQLLSSSSTSTNAADLMLMGFPTLLSSSGTSGGGYPSLCACHSKLYKAKGYLCPRCGSKLCEVPTECAVCKLTVVASPHLARSYRHLFPVPNWEAINTAPQSQSKKCFGCSVTFPPFAQTNGHVEPEAEAAAPKKNATGEVVVQSKEGAAAPGQVTAATSASGRYRCPKCSNVFCIDCDIFSHQLGACPGCQ